MVKEVLGYICLEWAELPVFLDNVGQVERGVFFGRFYVAVPHYLLQGAQVAALH
ncbi:unnamed protein product [marine sediment metagenome]|uniref:Uncharacterized protein n=1 Tax=marine sediment metagenome TaxID=412755 RepID=X1TSC2_9ZZZZ